MGRREHEAHKTGGEGLGGGGHLVILVRERGEVRQSRDEVFPLRDHVPRRLVRPLSKEGAKPRDHSLVEEHVWAWPLAGWLAGRGVGA